MNTGQVNKKTYLKNMLIYSYDLFLAASPQKMNPKPAALQIPPTIIRVLATRVSELLTTVRSTSRIPRLTGMLFILARSMPKLTQ